MAHADNDGVMLVERGRRADFELLDEPLTWADIDALALLRQSYEPTA